MLDRLQDWFRMQLRNYGFHGHRSVRMIGPGHYRCRWCGEEREPNWPNPADEVEYVVTRPGNGLCDGKFFEPEEAGRGS